MKQNYSEEQCKKAIMRRVRRVYFWRTIVQPFTLECAMLGALIGLSAFFVSLRNILINIYATHSVFAAVNLAIMGFVKTQVSVKVIALAGLVLAALITRDIAIKVSRATGRVVMRLREAF